MRENLLEFKDDLLDRKNIAINLTKIIENKSDLNVLAIDSKWGSGKTTFVTMWKNMIKKEFEEEFETMYFNAWENDYIEEPLLSLLDELNKQIKDSKGDCEQFWNRLKDKSKPYIDIAMQVGIKYLTIGAIDKSNLSELSKDGMEEFSCQVGKALIENVSKVKESRNEMKEILATFQRELNKKVIIFIDELDRCRPTFAIELLETIKHIFDIENYVFVISLDKEQLAHSIGTLYGEKMDSNGYLRRFFDLEYILPQSNTKNYIKYHNQKLIDKYEGSSYVYEILERSLTSQKYSLRDIDKTYKYLEIIFPLVKNELNNQIYGRVEGICISYIFVSLVNLKIMNSDLFNELLDSKNEKLERNKISKFNLINLSSIDIKLNVDIREYIKFEENEKIEDVDKIFDMYLEVYFLYQQYGNRYCNYIDIDEMSIYDKNGGYKMAVGNLYGIFEKCNFIKKMMFVEQFNI